MLSSKPKPPPHARSGAAQEREAAGKVLTAKIYLDAAAELHPRHEATNPDNAACSTMMHWYFASVDQVG